jgi:hypothetical protein
MCLNVSGNNYSSGAQIVAHQCNTVVTIKEQFEAYLVNDVSTAIQPAANWADGGTLCLNASGGIHQHASVILYPCGSYPQNGEWVTDFGTYPSQAAQQLAGAGRAASSARS